MPDAAPKANGRRPILVTGAHRSGTTWVGKMLAATPETAYISEPLNVLHRPGIFAPRTSRWYTYICRENEELYLPAYERLLKLKYDLFGEIRSLRSRKDMMRMGRDAITLWRGQWRKARPLIKDPFAVFSIPWFIERLNCEVVVTLRHPAAFASSLKKLGWPFDMDDLLQQPLLMRDWLEPYRTEMEIVLKNPDDIIGQGSLLWRVVYGAVAEFCRNYPQILLVRHDEFSLEPVENFRKLFGALNLTFSEATAEVIRDSSSAGNPEELSQKSVHSVRLDSRASLNNWKRRLPPADIDRIRRLTEDVAEQYYTEADW